ncbi:hypothetical protein DASC09_045700 [Saccharomycopsis crataegensis]|uniref:Uncharacterized protein n=1 Tax=Saccharomycopsis crataegensis TaxID=43959 RepID=A0AAV5QRR9_9ASCO|nr:hypothetical protein DASC09_045700 [Saccharomycopsis crataegensis]
MIGSKLFPWKSNDWKSKLLPWESSYMDSKSHRHNQDKNSIKNNNNKNKNNNNNANNTSNNNYNLGKSKRHSLDSLKHGITSRIIRRSGSSERTREVITRADLLAHSPRHWSTTPKSRSPTFEDLNDDEHQVVSYQPEPDNEEEPDNLSRWDSRDTGRLKLRLVVDSSIPIL